MEKYIKVKLSDIEIELSYNVAGVSELARLLQVGDPTPENISAEIIRMGVEDPFNLIKGFVYSGMYGYHFEFGNSIKPPYTLNEIGKKVLEMDEEQSRVLMDLVLKSLGYDLKIEEEPTKKKMPKK